MKIGIIRAGDKEFAPFCKSMKDASTRERALLWFYSGKLGNADVTALFSDVCKVNAAIACQALIDDYRPDFIINAGVCGGIDPDVELFDTVVSTDQVYHDVSPDILTDFHPRLAGNRFVSDERLIDAARRCSEVSPYTIKFGRMATGEYFVAGEGREKIQREFSPLTVDMETAAIAHVCFANRVPFIAVRCVTDTAARSGAGNFHKNCERASGIAFGVTRGLIAEVAR